MVERIKERLPSWEKGRNFMEDVASKYNLQLEERDEKLVARNSRMEIHFFPDPREFSLITAKIFDPAFVDELIQLINSYKN